MIALLSLMISYVRGQSARYLERMCPAGIHIKLVLGLFPWNTRAALSSMLGGEKIA